MLVFQNGMRFQLLWFVSQVVMMRLWNSLPSVAVEINDMDRGTGADSGGK
jgi:hypothetical protein